MKAFAITRYALSISAAALLASCGGSQTAPTQTSTAPLSLRVQSAPCLFCWKPKKILVKLDDKKYYATIYYDRTYPPTIGASCKGGDLGGYLYKAGVGYQVWEYNYCCGDNHVECKVYASYSRSVYTAMKVTVDING